jgi:IS5 family transposase
MEHPPSFADSEYQNKRRQTRKEKFLEWMEMLIPLQTTSIRDSSAQLIR